MVKLGLLFCHKDFNQAHLILHVFKLYGMLCIDGLIKKSSQTNANPANIYVLEPEKICIPVIQIIMKN